MAPPLPIPSFDLAAVGKKLLGTLNPFGRNNRFKVQDNALIMHVTRILTRNAEEFRGGFGCNEALLLQRIEELDSVASRVRSGLKLKKRSGSNWALSVGVPRQLQQFRDAMSACRRSGQVVPVGAAGSVLQVEKQRQRRAQLGIAGVIGLGLAAIVGIGFLARKRAPVSA